LNYFKQWTGWRRMRTALAIAVPVLAIVWIAAVQLSGDSHPATSGPLARAHSFFSNDCGACHAKSVNGERKGGFIQHTSDEACLNCHAAPAHQPTQTFTPSCASCHVEHEGATRLAIVAERNCTQCHGDLRTRDRARVERQIHGFNSDHPEFAALLVKDGDPGTIAFNHAVHLKSIEGPDGKRVTPECSDCHRVGSELNAPWRFAAANYKPNSSTDRAYMEPPTYAGSCAGCHDLRFDPNIKEAAPHDKPEVVYAFLQKTYSGTSKAAFSRPIRLVPATYRLQANTPTEHIAVAARLLWGKTCKECHQLSFGEDGSASLPTVAAPGITPVWLPKAKFNHESHRSFSCTSCHEQTETSQQSNDVLVPGIAICQTCHNGDPRQEGHAENRCYECHDYHDWKLQPAFKGRYDFEQWKRRTGR
jgi:hypothetical protein